MNYYLNCAFVYSNVDAIREISVSRIHESWRARIELYTVSPRKRITRRRRLRCAKKVTKVAVFSEPGPRFLLLFWIRHHHHCRRRCYWTGPRRVEPPRSDADSSRIKARTRAPKVSRIFLGFSYSLASKSRHTRFEHLDQHGC